ncbi:MAG: hypothetical protein PHC56_12390 [Herbinix sp.]|nr:hypothetical protein [Herbinix sp.]
MGLLAIPLIILVYWIIDKVQEKQGEKQYKEYQEDLKRRGLK